MLKPGIQHQETLIVTDQHTAKTVQSGGLEVLSTPMLIALMEKTAWKSVIHFMENGYDSVGFFIEMSHLKPTLLNKQITAKSTLVSINKKELLFQIEAFEENKQIAFATHKRAIIQIDSFMEKASS